MFFGSALYTYDPANSLVLFALFYYLVHTCSILFANGIRCLQQSGPQASVAELDVDLITGLYFGPRLGYFAVDADPPLVAGILCHGPAFYDPGILQEFIDTHELPRYYIS